MNKTEIQNQGFNLIRNYTIAVCAIVRDCNKSLQRNIPVIEELRSHFKSSVVIIFENDSKDQTKYTLKDWSKNSSNVHINCEDNGTRTIPEEATDGVNKYYSDYRISKMVSYRNKYLNKLEEIDFNPDFVLVVDLDVSRIYLEGIIHSFGLADQWDVVCANGYSLSPMLRTRYHDSYALVELGKEDIPQTEESIKENSRKWNIINNSDSLIPIYSGHGGLSIYRFEAVKNLKYRLIKNDDSKVEVRCEHFSLCSDIRKNGYNRIFLNPELKLKYQTVNFNLLKKFVVNNLHSKIFFSR